MIIKEVDEAFGSTMVIVPHQDDEILLAAGVIYESIKKNLSVHIVMVTNGDYGSTDFTIGRIRLSETVKGTSLLGVKNENLILLGYADTGMPKADSFITHLFGEKDPRKVYPSSCSQETYGLKNKQEYHMKRYQKHALYCRSSLKQDLKEVIADIKADNIITTSEFDLHGDHSALYGFVREILLELKGEIQYTPNLYTGIVHSNAGDENWPEKNTSTYHSPEGFENETMLKWEDRITIPVPKCMRIVNESNNLKLQSLLKYNTALEPTAYEFLMSFIKDEEIFWQIDY